MISLRISKYAFHIKQVSLYDLDRVLRLCLKEPFLICFHSISLIQKVQIKFQTYFRIDQFLLIYTLILHHMFSLYSIVTSQYLNKFICLLEFIHFLTDPTLLKIIVVLVFMKPTLILVQNFQASILQPLHNIWLTIQGNSTNKYHLFLVRDHNYLIDVSRLFQNTTQPILLNFYPRQFIFQLIIKPQFYYHLIQSVSRSIQRLATPILI